MAVLLSNHPRFLGQLDDSIRSSLQPELVYFANYDSQQLGQILIGRAREGLKAIWEGHINKIAAMTTRLTPNADARVAIKTLYYVVIEQAAIEDIEDLFERARRDLVTDVLLHLNERSLLVLQAAIEVEHPLAKAVYERYCELCRDLHVEPTSYVHFYNTLSYLQGLGLVLLVEAKVGKAYARRVDCIFDKGVFEAVYKSRFVEA